MATVLIGANTDAAKQSLAAIVIATGGVTIGWPREPYFVVCARQQAIVPTRQFADDVGQKLPIDIQVINSDDLLITPVRPNHRCSYGRVFGCGKWAGGDATGLIAYAQQQANFAHDDGPKIIN